MPARDIVEEVRRKLLVVVTVAFAVLVYMYAIRRDAIVGDREAPVGVPGGR